MFQSKELISLSLLLALATPLSGLAANIKTYNSGKFGVTIEYDADMMNGKDVVEKYDSMIDFGGSQSVHVFGMPLDQKWGDDFILGIGNLDLESVKEKCEVTYSDIEVPGYGLAKKAEISLKEEYRSTNSEDPWFANFKEICGSYATTNGVSYFLYMPEQNTHKVLYLSIGQAVAPFSDQKIAFNNTFPDVKSSYAYKDAIEYARARGIVEGYSDGTYRPNDSIDRAEFVKIISTAKNWPWPQAYCFPDVPADGWFSNYVCAAYEHGVIAGYPDGYFRPGNTLNVAEALKIVLKSYGAGVRNATSEEEWYAPYAEYAQGSGLYLDSFKSLGTNLTRGEMAELIYLLEK